ncbi:MAG: PDZ domain-containing protein, partial [Alphaproteobacteria bacterium]|nr:PDZ domain-containing protein [Alphaproteobacteria bacterium]
MRLIGFFFWAILVCAGGAHAAELFHPDEPVQNGLNVFDVSAVFTDIYKKLDSVSWAGKDVNVAIESLEKLNPDAHIAVTDDRVVLVWRDSIIANYPRPAARDWDGFGQITTALLLKLRERDAALRGATESEMYQMVVDTLMRGVDENGRYIYSQAAEMSEDRRILTSVGLEGARDDRGNFRITGVYKGAPADISGIMVGDIIAEINGTPVTKMSDADLASVMAGFNSGTSKITLLTPTGTRHVVLRRATIVLADADVVYRRGNGDNPGLLEIIVHRVSDGAVAIVNEALAQYADSVSGIILDLRSAAGDNERAAAKLAGLFVGAVPVMRIVETARAEVEVVPGGRAVTQVPVVVLVSNMTRGTAEA